MGRHAVHGTHTRVAVTTLLVALVVFAGTVAALTLSGGSDGPSTGTPTASGPPATGGSARTVSGSPPAGDSPTAMAMAPTVTLRLVGTSWVRVAVPGGRVLTTGTFRRGESMTFRNRVVEVTVGNAAAVRLQANGMAMELGGRGVVRRVTVTRGGD